MAKYLVFILLNFFLIFFPYFAYSICLKDVLFYHSGQRLKILDRYYPNSPEWSDQIVRYKGAAVSSEFEDYAQNMLNAVKNVFFPWFHKGKIADFHSMLDKHNQMIIGEGIPTYGGFSDQSIQKVSGGVERSVDSTLTTEYFRIQATHFKDNFPSHVLEKQKTNKPKDPYQPTLQQNTKADHVNIEGIPQEAYPLNIYERTVVAHRYPHPKFLKLYRDQMYKIIQEIQKFSKLFPSEKNRNKLLINLSDYYHTGINAHIYERANNSMLMAQVNVILEFNGLKPISHGDLDYLALLTDTIDFRKIFLDALK